MSHVVIRTVRPYATEEAFLQAEGWTLSRRGVILLDQRPQAVGAKVRFEVRLSAGQSVMRAEGTVESFRAAIDGAPSQLSIHFTRFDASTKALIASAEALAALTADEYEDVDALLELDEPPASSERQAAPSAPGVAPPGHAARATESQAAVSEAEDEPELVSQVDELLSQVDDPELVSQVHELVSQAGDPELVSPVDELVSQTGDPELMSQVHELEQPSRGGAGVGAPEGPEHDSAPLSALDELISGALLDASAPLDAALSPEAAGAPLSLDAESLSEPEQHSLRGESPSEPELGSRAGKAKELTPPPNRDELLARLRQRSARLG